MRTFPLVLTFLTFVACNMKEASGQNNNNSNAFRTATLRQEEKEERNKKVALANAEAIRAHDIDAASKNFAPDIVNYGNGNIPPQKGIEAVTASLRMFTRSFPIDSIENLVAVADGDWVMLWGKWSGTWKEDFMGQKATGKPFTKREVEIYRFNDKGEITEHHSVQSINEIAQQVGLKMPGK